MRTTQTDQPNGDAETPKQTPETESAADHQSGRYDIDRLNG
jgi:hypothetical protein